MVLRRDRQVQDDASETLLSLTARVLQTPSRIR
jgi:hypothetical protein